MRSLLLNGHETAVLFSFQNGINILEARSEPGVESVFFLSEIGSGFLQPGGTPPPRIRRSSPGFPLLKQKNRFDSLVSPVLLYNCEIWGCFLKSVGNNYDKFVSRIFDERITPENIHNKVCKMALGVHSKAPCCAPLHLIIYTRIFKYL